MTDMKVTKMTVVVDDSGVKVFSPSGAIYDLKRGRDGVEYCSCPAWKYQHLSPKFRTCKHLNAARAMGVSLGGKPMHGPDPLPTV